MPPRLSKRQQREQEELEALAGPSNVQSSEDILDEDQDARSRKEVSRRVTGFAAVS
jgi:transcription factor 25